MTPNLSRINDLLEGIVNKEGQDILENIKKLDMLSTQSDIHPKLRHFLTNRSYIKALDWIKENT